MKKLLVFALVLALLAVPIVHAEDYASMSDEELWSANKAIQAELWARSIAKDGVKISQGKYVIGEDIPAGVYRIVLAETENLCFIYAYYYDELYEMEDNKILSLKNDAPEIGKFDTEGYTAIEFSNPVIFYAYTGLFN